MLVKIKSEQEEAIEKIDKINGYQLPNKFKIIGLVLFISSIILVFIISIYLGSLNTKIYFTESLGLLQF
ncbi:hypothetical protein CXF59_11900 [Flavobacterium sp. ALD4]|nr:hypothetical protein CXF59_11900 [Flavobacterium sp. ALD4]